MSLDVYLSRKRRISYDDGKTFIEDTEEVYWSNITHNLSRMADAAGIGDCLWSPDVLGFEKASQLIEPLKSGLEKLKTSPEIYEKYNASNGWGLYVHFVPFVQQYLDACIAYPDSIVSVSK
jgi:hypothetical protein